MLNLFRSFLHSSTKVIKIIVIGAFKEINKVKLEDYNIWSNYLSYEKASRNEHLK